MKDHPGIVAEIAGALATEKINIDALFQRPGYEKGSLPFVVTVEPCAASALRRALDRIATRRLARPASARHAHPWRVRREAAMPMFATVIAGITTLLTLAGFGYYLVALWSARAFLRRPASLPALAPPVSILKPLHGARSRIAEAFASHCRQNYSGEYEFLFGVSSPRRSRRRRRPAAPDRFPRPRHPPDLYPRSPRTQRQSQQPRAAGAPRPLRFPRHQRQRYPRRPALSRARARALRAREDQRRPASSPLSIAAAPTAHSAPNSKPLASAPTSPPAC